MVVVWLIFGEYALLRLAKTLLEGSPEPGSLLLLVAAVVTLVGSLKGEQARFNLFLLGAAVTLVAGLLAVAGLALEIDWMTSGPVLIAGLLAGFTTVTLSFSVEDVGKDKSSSD